MNIVLIGTGNVATVFGRMLKAAGNTIVQVYGRDAGAAALLAGELHSASCNSWSAIIRQADLYLIALSDKALYELDQHLVLTGQVAVHTAGSVPKEVLQKITSRYGVLYPLQSLRKDMPVLTTIPLLVDASGQETLELVLQVARGISAQVSVAGNEQRLKLHVAAVFVNNFVNHLYAIAEDFCKQEDIPFHLLYPLAAETAERLNHVSPLEVLTGPAVRNDWVTINRHLELLSAYPAIRSLYAQMTESITRFQGGST